MARIIASLPFSVSLPFLYLTPVLLEIISRQYLYQSSAPFIGSTLTSSPHLEHRMSYSVISTQTTCVIKRVQPTCHEVPNYDVDIISRFGVSFITPRKNSAREPRAERVSPYMRFYTLHFCSFSFSVISLIISGSYARHSVTQRCNYSSTCRSPGSLGKLNLVVLFTSTYCRSFIVDK